MKKIKEAVKAGQGEAGKEKRVKGKRASFSGYFLLTAVFLGGLLNFSCQPNQQIMNSSANVAAPTPLASAETKRNSVEKEVRDLQTADFDYIFVVRRKDGAAFDTEDRKYLRQNTPPETNRFISADEGKVFVIGSSFEFFPDQMEALKQRFNIEDFSKPKEESNSRTNQSNRPENDSQSIKPKKPQTNKTENTNR